MRHGHTVTVEQWRIQGGELLPCKRVTWFVQVRSAERISRVATISVTFGVDIYKAHSMGLGHLGTGEHPFCLRSARMRIGSSACIRRCCKINDGEEVE